MTTIRTRPADITVVGVLWLGMSSFGLLASALLNAMYWSVMRDPAWAVPHGSRAAGRPELFDWIFGHFGLVLAVQLGLTAATTYASWSFLQRRSWSRYYLQTVCWLAIVYTMAFVALWLRAWLSIGDPVGANPSVSSQAQTLHVFGVLVACLVCLFWVGIPGVMIWYLRRSATRAWFGRRDDEEAP